MKRFGHFRIRSGERRCQRSVPRADEVPDRPSTDRCTTKAPKGLCWLGGDGSRLAASSLAVIHVGILDAIERQRYDVFHHCDLSAAQKSCACPAPGDWPDDSPPNRCLACSR